MIATDTVLSGMQSTSGAKRSRILLALTGAYASTFLFEALLRYGLMLTGMASMLYLREVIPLIIVAYLFLAWVYGERWPLWPLCMFAIITLHLVVGILFHTKLMQLVVGYKMFMTIFVGIVAAYHYPGSSKVLSRIAGVVLIITIAAISINKYLIFPWEGSQYETFFGAAELTKVWWTDGGLRRLSGFSRASYDAASVALVCVIIYLAGTTSRMKALLAWILTGIAIALTTSKGALFAWCAVGIAAVFSNTGVRVVVLRITLFIAAIICITVPLFFWNSTIAPKDFYGAAGWWFSSFADRISWTWPKAFSLLTENGSIIFGRGIGGIGTSQMFGDWWQFNPADNLFVYMIVSFGLLGIVYCGWMLSIVMHWAGQNRHINFMVYGLVASYFIYGIVMNMIEQPVMTLAFGFALGLALRDSSVNTATVSSKRTFCENKLP